MDTILAICGLAIGVASLVPAFTTKKRKAKIVAVAILLTFVGIFVAQCYSAYIGRRQIAQAKNDIIIMMSGNNPMSFEQIYSQLNHIDYPTAEAAVNELVDEHSIHSRPVAVTAPSGDKYVVRVYNSINFPIP